MNQIREDLNREDFENKMIPIGPIGIGNILLYKCISKMDNIKILTQYDYSAFDYWVLTLILRIWLTSIRLSHCNSPVSVGDELNSSCQKCNNL